jgi:hypothetical protein
LSSHFFHRNPAQNKRTTIVDAAAAVAPAEDEGVLEDEDEDAEMEAPDAKAPEAEAPDAEAPDAEAPERASKKPKLAVGVSVSLCHVLCPITSFHCLTYHLSAPLAAGSAVRGVAEYVRPGPRLQEARAGRADAGAHGELISKGGKCVYTSALPLLILYCAPLAQAPDPQPEPQPKLLQSFAERLADTFVHACKNVPQDAADEVWLFAQAIASYRTFGGTVKDEERWHDISKDNSYYPAMDPLFEYKVIEVRTYGDARNLYKAWQYMGGHENFAVPLQPISDDIWLPVGIDDDDVQPSQHLPTAAQYAARRPPQEPQEQPKEQHKSPSHPQEQHTPPQQQQHGGKLPFTPAESVAEAPAQFSKLPNAVHAEVAASEHGEGAEAPAGPSQAPVSQVPQSPASAWFGDNAVLRRANSELLRLEAEAEKAEAEAAAALAEAERAQKNAPAITRTGSAITRADNMMINATAAAERACAARELAKAAKAAAAKAPQAGVQVSIHTEGATEGATTAGATATAQ